MRLSMEKDCDLVVLLSTYNGDKFLREQIDSIISQENVNIKILIRDDGSNDNTLKIIQEYSFKYPKLISLIEGQNVGFYESFSILIKKALLRFPNAQYFAFSDQDDFWHPDKCSTAISLISKRPGPNMYCCRPTTTDSQLHPICQYDDKSIKPNKSRALINNIAYGCTILFNRDAAILYTDRRPLYGFKLCHDFIMYQLCIFLGDVYYDHNSYIYYRQHGTNEIGNKRFWARMKERFQFKNNAHYYELENAAVYDSIKDLLSEQDKIIISKIINYRKSLKFKIKLLMDGSIRYTKFESNIFYWFKILLGVL